MRLPVILAVCLLLPVVDVQSQTLTIDEPTFDFGEINDINLVYKTVTLTNTGDAELEIKRVKGTCGCTTGKLEKEMLEPGESTSLTIQFLPATLIRSQLEQLAVIVEKTAGAQEQRAFDLLQDYVDSQVRNASSS